MRTRNLRSEISNLKSQISNPVRILASMADGNMILAGTLTIDAGGGEGAAAKKPRFQLDAYNGGPMNVAGWRYPVIIDGSGITVAAGRIPIYLTHSESVENLVGQSDTVQVENGKITASGPLTASRETSAGYARMLDHAANGYQWQSSIGAGVQRYEFVDEGRQALVNGKTVSGPLYIARKVTLQHIAIVPLGADTTTKANLETIAADGGQENRIMTFEQWVLAQGHKLADLSAEQKASLQAAYDSLKAAGALPAIKAEGGEKNPPQGEDTEKAKGKTKTVKATAGEGDGDGDDEMTQRRSRLAAEHKRVAAIEEKAKGHPKIIAQAIEENWTVEKTELEVLRAERSPSGGGIAIHSGGDTGIEGSHIEAALCLQAGLKEPQKHFEAPVLEAASKRLGRVGLMEVIMLAAAACGWAGRITASSFKANHREILSHAFGAAGAIRAGFSTVSIGGILSNVANKFLLQSFNAVESAWRSIARINPAGDFKTMTRYRLTNSGEYAKVGPDGELKHGKLGEESYTNKAETFGKMLTITRQDQINDDLGALTQIPAQLGGDGGRALNSEFWTAFEDNATFFSAAHKNLVGTTGRPWYLLADPSEMPVMEVAFLDGRDTPVIESAEADFSTLGLQMRSYFDFGCAKAEYRAGIMSHTALSLTALEAGMKLFNDQTIDAAGVHPVALTPRILLVATGDQVTAMNIFKASEIRDTTASTKAPTANVFQGMFSPVVSRYLANS